MRAFDQAQYVASIGKLSQLPPTGPPEIAFCGRSNVGKSSAINALTGRKRLAFTSKTPGRTQTINFFDIGEGLRLADLPGYGFARVPQAVRAQWDRLVGGYLSARETLAALVVIMDARRPFTEHDARMLDWAQPLGRPVLVLLSKADKLGKRERSVTLAQARDALAARGLRGEVRLFSSVTRESVDEVRALIVGWADAWNAEHRHKKTPGKGE
ncbi:MAG: ribosome biogenesis GTP-binding protein YihA/YsxC [Betaproteobacteria bacterium]|jgi:GTP-binding protein|nr:ribosome biogenesis GTP-binding protein YihA/YsxC [Betaproteobacteria bacterium]